MIKTTVLCRKADLATGRKPIRYIGSMRMWLILLLMGLITVVTAQSPVRDTAAVAIPVDTVPNRLLEPGKEHWLSNIDIIGESGIGSVFILMDALDLSVEMKNILSSREFSKDEFFMQNIDREEFEQERQLSLFEDRKRKFFQLFPEEKDKE